jgi:hypothetical protein
VSALKNVQALNDVPDHVKNYRPKILVLSGVPAHRQPLVDFANLLTKKLSLLVCAHVEQVKFLQYVHLGLNNDPVPNIQITDLVASFLKGYPLFPEKLTGFQIIVQTRFIQLKTGLVCYLNTVYAGSEYVQWGSEIRTNPNFGWSILT